MLLARQKQLAIPAFEMELGINEKSHNLIQPLIKEKHIHVFALSGNVQLDGQSFNKNASEVKRRSFFPRSGGNLINKVSS
jgi:hypothetical protein